MRTNADKGSRELMNCQSCPFSTIEGYEDEYEGRFDCFGKYITSQSRCTRDVPLYKPRTESDWAELDTRYHMAKTSPITTRFKRTT